MTQANELYSLTPAWNARPTAGRGDVLMRTGVEEKADSQLEATLEAIQDGIIVFDCSGKLVTANRAMRRMLESIGAGDPGVVLDLDYCRAHYQLYSDQGLLPFEQWPASRAMRGETIQGLELCCRRLDSNRERYFSFSGGPIRDAEGTVTRAVIVVRDISEAKQAGSLRATLKLRDEFLSIASHELKTPLTSLHLALQMIRRLAAKEPPLSLEQVEHLTDRALASSQRLASLIDELFDLTRIQGGVLKLEKCEMDLRDCVESVVSQSRDEAARKGSAVSVKSGRSVVGYWDPVRIEQIVFNLMSNAIRYGEGRPIEVSIGASGYGHARLEVRDHGIGIPPELQGPIFDRLERGGRADKLSGLGVGLYIARQTVEAHGGRIWVESEPGKGSCFKIELPLRADGGKA